VSDDLWGRITAVPRPHKLVDFPRRFPAGIDAPRIAIQVLTQEEQMVCAAAAEDFTRKSFLSRDKSVQLPRDGEAHQGYDDLYRNAAAIEILFRACRNPDDLKKPAFPSPALMRAEFTNDETGVLMSHYHSTQSELGPIVARMTKEEVDAFVDRLVASGDRFPLDLLSPEVLKSLLTSMASRLRSLQTDSSSDGSQPDDASTSASTESHPAAES